LNTTPLYLGEGRFFRVVKKVGSLLRI